MSRTFTLFIVDKDTSKKLGADGEKGRKKGRKEREEEEEREQNKEEDEEGVAAIPGSMVQKIRLGTRLRHGLAQVEIHPLQNKET